MITIQDIARKAEVSTATVSRVLNKRESSIPISSETKKKVLQIAGELGYSPNIFAKSLRTKKSMLVGVVVWDLTDFFYSDILRGIENTLHTTAYNLLLNSAEANTDRKRTCLEKMRDLHADGVLLVGGTATAYRNYIDELGLNASSIVLVGTSLEEGGLNSVTVDNYTGGYIGMEYLLNRLNRRSGTFAYIAGSRMTSDMEKRLMGVERAVDDAGKREAFRVFHTGPGEQAGYDAAADLLSAAELPASIFAVSDPTAFGAIRAVQDRNLRVPEDVAVLGFDDISISTFFQPRLSTIRQPRYEMGEMGTNLLIEAMDRAAEGRKEPATGKGAGKGAGAGTRQILLSPELTIRESA